MNLIFHRFLKIVCFIILMEVAMLFAKQNIEDYIAGRTSYSIGQAPLTLFDLPTLTICLNSREVISSIPKPKYRDYGLYVYGRNFTIKLSIPKHSTATNTTSTRMSGSTIQHPRGPQGPQTYRYSTSVRFTNTRRNSNNMMSSNGYSSNQHGYSYQ